MAKRYVLRPDGSGGPLETVRRIDYEKELNERQRDAALHGDGPVLVIAGAGSGKTRTLIYRVAGLIEKNIAPEAILLLTFTRRAAEEMLHRAAGMLDGRCNRVAGGTFHGFANRLLHKYATAIGFSTQFTVLDQGDSEDVIKMLRSAGGHDKKEKRFPRKKTINSIISMSRSKNIDIGEIIELEYPQFSDYTDDIETIASAYHEFKRQNSLMDYDDLLICFVQLMQDNENIRREIGALYRYVMVDEYQDTNQHQAQIAALIAQDHRNVMAVGDDAQSIYSFRGSNFRNIMDFPQLFPDTEIIRLEENFRSRQPILDLTNAVIELAAEKYSKTLFTRRKGGGKPILIRAQSTEEQAYFISQRILELREEGIPLNEIAVLYRSSFHAFGLELELNGRNIPYVKYGGLKFAETAHVKDVMAHFRALVNPRDEVSWARILLLIEGIGPKSCRTMLDAIRASSDPVKALEKPPFSRGKAGIIALNDLLKKISDELLPPADRMNLVIEYYRPFLEAKYDDHPKRIRDLEQLVVMTEKYTSIESLLSDLALELPKKSARPQRSDDDEFLILSTIHSAKGLEWHTVFIMHLLEGCLPSKFALENSDAMEEERRLIYVAMTRAKENLYLSYPAIMGGGNWYSDDYFVQPSRFITELPDGLFDEWLLEESRPGF